MNRNHHYCPFSVCCFDLSLDIVISIWRCKDEDFCTSLVSFHSTKSRSTSRSQRILPRVAFRGSLFVMVCGKPICISTSNSSTGPNALFAEVTKQRWAGIEVADKQLVAGSQHLLLYECCYRFIAQSPTLLTCYSGPAFVNSRCKNGVKTKSLYPRFVRLYLWYCFIHILALDATILQAKFCRHPWSSVVNQL